MIRLCRSELRIKQPVGKLGIALYHGISVNADGDQAFRSPAVRS
jgi:hypothetical protein